MTALLAIGKWCLEYWYVVVLAALIGGLAFWGGKNRVALDEVRAEYSGYRQKIAEAAQAATEAALKKTIADEQAKEKADAEHQKTVATLDASIRSLRDERDAARRSFLPAPSTSARGSDITCFDRAEYLAAYGRLVAGLRELGDEGTAATVDLDTAKSWAR